tara:strand:+ start:226 stop:501 length:276 start_codon:yes stop_codon:yes gene_type:complete
MKMHYARDRILFFPADGAHIFDLCPEQKRAVGGTDICAVGVDAENVMGQGKGLSVNRVHGAMVGIDADFEFYDFHWPFSSFVNGRHRPSES